MGAAPCPSYARSNVTQLLYCERLNLPALSARRARSRSGPFPTLPRAHSRAARCLLPPCLLPQSQKGAELIWRYPILLDACANEVQRQGDAMMSKWAEVSCCCWSCISAVERLVAAVVCWKEAGAMMSKWAEVSGCCLSCL